MEEYDFLGKIEELCDEIKGFETEIESAKEEIKGLKETSGINDVQETIAAKRAEIDRNRTLIHNLVKQAKGKVPMPDAAKESEEDADEEQDGDTD